MRAHATAAAAFTHDEGRKHHLVTGGVRSYDRPRQYNVTRTFPELTNLYADRAAGTIFYPSQRALGAAIDHE
eukprot:1251517-Prymnesium_polylepis.1